MATGGSKVTVDESGKTPILKLSQTSTKGELILCEFPKCALPKHMITCSSPAESLHARYIEQRMKKFPGSTPSKQAEVIRKKLHTADEKFADRVVAVHNWCSWTLVGWGLYSDIGVIQPSAQSNVVVVFEENGTALVFASADLAKGTVLHCPPSHCLRSWPPPHTELRSAFLSHFSLQPSFEPIVPKLEDSDPLEHFRASLLRYSLHHMENLPRVAQLLRELPPTQVANLLQDDREMLFHFFVDWVRLVPDGWENGYLLFSRLIQPSTNRLSMLTDWLEDPEIGMLRLIRDVSDCLVGPEVAAVRPMTVKPKRTTEPEEKK